MNGNGKKHTLLNAAWEVVRGGKKTLLFVFCTLILFWGILFLYGESAEPVLYASFLILVLGGVFFGISTVKEYRNAMRRERISAAVLTEWKNLPSPDTAPEADYQKMIEKVCNEYETLMLTRNNEQTEMIDYYTTWVHQIKTPISVMHLLLRNEDSEINRALSTELFRVEQYVEMALNFTRLGSESNDLSLSECDVDEMIRQCIRKYAPSFIQRKLRLEYRPFQKTIITDRKWFQFVLEQILSNAIKYTMKGSITIYLTEKGELAVSDTGIGIDPSDLPRIFEKGFTGLNGRTGNKSTGIGLYLSRKAAGLLGIPIRAESIPGTGSTFYLDLNQKTLPLD